MARRLPHVLPKEINGISAVLGLCTFMGLLGAIPVVLISILAPGRIDPLYSYGLPAIVLLYGFLTVWTHRRHERKIAARGPVYKIKKQDSKDRTKTGPTNKRPSKGKGMTS